MIKMTVLNFDLRRLCLTLLVSIGLTNLWAQKFQSIPSTTSKIDFSNNIEAFLSTNENLLDFDYFYNGAGVGVADLNNDGLVDIVFCGNQVDNKIYKNKGEFVFEDVTSKSPINQKKYWSNGVSFSDINKDGLLDIYLCQGGPGESDQRANLLLINKGDFVFEEQGLAYGLDDKGISTQAVFFDFDNDGDEDCFVVNESIAYGFDPITFKRMMLEKRHSFQISYSHLYENRQDTFVDVSFEMGMTSPSFGLGVSVADLNEDGWLDLYMANDYYLPDVLYINQGGAFFEDQTKSRIKHNAFYGMGVDIADINNDGKQDIFVLDMASQDHYRAKTLMRSMNVGNFKILVHDFNYPYQYMFNALQLNNGLGNFNNIAHHAGVASTDWSWTVLMQDFDLDGFKDCYITNGYKKYGLDNDFQQLVFETKQKYQGQVPLTVKRQLYDQIPTEKLSNIMYQNQGQLDFKRVEKSWGLEQDSYSNGAASADLDNDGDLDLVINNIDEKAFVYKNMTRENGVGNSIKIQLDVDQRNDFITAEAYIGDTYQLVDSKAVRGYMSSSDPNIIIGLGNAKKVDSLKVHLRDGSSLIFFNIAANELVSLSEGKSTALNLNDNQPNDLKVERIDPKSLGLKFKHRENTYEDFESEILLPYKQSTRGPFLSQADLNNDGLDDLVISNAAGLPNYIYHQNETGFELLKDAEFITHAAPENAEAGFLDLNQDGIKDIVFLGSGNEKKADDEFYQDGIFMSGEKGYSRSPLSVMKSSGSKVVNFDLDEDQDEDLFVANRIIPQHYPKHAPSQIFRNDNGQLVDVTNQVCPELNNFGIINEVVFTDFDLDGKQDFIVVGEWTEVGMFQNQNGKYKNVSNKYLDENKSGLWFSIRELEMNNDGKPDYVLGNIGTNSKYTANPAKPLKVFGGDFDENGTWDLVLSKVYNDKFVPLRGKECSTQQMPFIESKFPTYDLFANATIEEVLGPNINESYERSINTTASYALLSNAKGKYEFKSLPVEAQLFPILDIEIADVDLDGQPDVVLAGNIYDTEVETPRLDAGEGLVLLSKNGKFLPLSLAKSKIDLTGNIKSITSIYHQGLNQRLLIAAENDGPLRIFSY